MKRHVHAALILLALTLPALLAPAAQAKKVRPSLPAKNVIVMIADGRGYNQLLATDYYQYGCAGAQSYESFPRQAFMSTYPAGSSYDPLFAWSSWSWSLSGYTDSAAAATAMATGVKTYNGVIGEDTAGNAVTNLTEHAEALGKSTGVVTTVLWDDATPAAFIAHNSSRGNLDAIATEMVDTSSVDVLMGTGNPWYDADGVLQSSPSYGAIPQTVWDELVAGTAGGDADGDGLADPWTLIQSKTDFADLATSSSPPSRVCGVPEVYDTLQQARSGDIYAAPYVEPLNTSVPDLATMSQGALNVVDRNPKGFFLMIEGGAIDHACHSGEQGRLIEEHMDFDSAVNAVIAWVEANSSWKDTLLIVTSDHETGYLWGPGSDPDWNPIVNSGPGALPGMAFYWSSHSNSLVPVFARGPSSARLQQRALRFDPVRGRFCDNTDVSTVAMEALR